MNSLVSNSNVYEHFGLESYSITKGLHDTDWEIYAHAIENLLQAYSISDGQLEEVTGTYEQIAEYLNDELSEHGIELTYYPQGSLQQKTAVRSTSSNKFDLDLIARSSNRSHIEALDLLDLIEQALRAHEEYGNGLEPKNRCVMLPLPGQFFTVDITPGIPVENRVNEPEWKEDSDPLMVGDRKQPPHKPSNPKGFSSWLNSRAALIPACLKFEIAKRATMESLGSTDPIPSQEKALSDVLRRTIQLLKLHRDAYYRKHENLEQKRFKPISILMTTLVARSYEDSYQNPQLSAVELMLEVIERMPKHILMIEGRYTVENPTIRGENFADKWNDPETGHRRVKNFLSWHRQVCTDLTELLTSSDSKVIRESANRAFGVEGIALAALLLELLPDDTQADTAAPESSGALLRSYLSSEEPSGFNAAPKESNHA